MGKICGFIDAMESKSDKTVHDRNESTPAKDVLTGTSYSKTNEKDMLKNFTRRSQDDARTIADTKDGGKGPNDTPLEEIGVSGDVNMEASITPQDVIQAGGLGARDDISSFLPVASDSTNFEASIRDAQDYEEPHSELSRPGLGWTGTTNEK